MHSLFKATYRNQLEDARTNAAVMPTAKRYPNSVGRALIDKADRGRTRHALKWARLRRQIRALGQSTHRFDP